eukprot:RCo002074
MENGWSQLNASISASLTGGEYAGVTSPPPLTPTPLVYPWDGTPRTGSPTSAPVGLFSPTAAPALLPEQFAALQSPSGMALESSFQSWPGSHTPAAGAFPSPHGNAALLSSPNFSGPDVSSKASDPQELVRQFESQRGSILRGPAPTPFGLSQSLGNYFRPEQLIIEKNRVASESFDLNTQSASAALSRGLEELLMQTRKFLPADFFDIFRTVRYEHLTYTAKIPAEPEDVDTVGRRFLELFLFWKRFRKIPREILHDLTGTLRPGKATLVLGPPQVWQELVHEDPFRPDQGKS